ncbi:hypothetical protein HU200_063573 [Digitaria exilis]|uniref:Uncharacterized protein n=1 Tax=Digitaria exilis TaxID=1010633 RepID=A0A835A542_9POAL|nr:hypothetical protein HU200_063573 [Digitaria exilis]
MASYFASQLKDMFFVLVERVTGYGWGESQDGTGKYPGTPAKTYEDVSPTGQEVTAVENIQIRARSAGADPFVNMGSKPQVE